MSVQKPWRTVMVGFGKIAAGYASDAQMSRHFRFSTHIQALAAHADFSLVGVVEPDTEAADIARERWNAPLVVEHWDQLPPTLEPEVVILATPPTARLELLQKLPTSVRAVFCEKPLARSMNEARSVLEWSRARQVLLQVNLWRRGDQSLRKLADGELRSRVGEIQIIQGLYGNGLSNNGTHLIDFVRWLGGELEWVQAIGPLKESPVSGEWDVPFAAQLKSGALLTVSALDFIHYREVALDIWGQNGRLWLGQETLDIRFFERQPHRAMTGAMEIASDASQVLPVGGSEALYHLYTNLSEALQSSAPLWADVSEALRAAEIVDAILQSAYNGGVRRQV